MTGPRNENVPRDNWILAALPADERNEIDPLLTRVQLAPRHVIHEPDQPIRRIAFPIDCVLSLVTMPMRDGQIIEVATIGNEGLVGLPVYLGATTAPVRCFCQVPGGAWMMHVDDFEREASRLPGLRELLNLYVQSLFNQIAQAGACNRAHDVSQRAARWLLMTHDRVGVERFQLRKEFLGQMLGVRPPDVESAVNGLERAGIIGYEAVLITILDRRRLEGATCECYGIIRKELDRLQPPGQPEASLGTPARGKKLPPL